MSVCDICYLVTNVTILDCTHASCSDCINDIIIYHQEKNEEPLCPVCHVKLSVADDATEKVEDIEPYMKKILSFDTNPLNHDYITSADIYTHYASKMLDVRYEPYYKAATKLSDANEDEVNSYNERLANIVARIQAVDSNTPVEFIIQICNMIDKLKKPRIDDIRLVYHIYDPNIAITRRDYTKLNPPERKVIPHSTIVVISTDGDIVARCNLAKVYIGENQLTVDQGAVSDMCFCGDRLLVLTYHKVYVCDKRMVVERKISLSNIHPLGVPIPVIGPIGMIGATGVTGPTGPIGYGMSSYIPKPTEKYFDTIRYNFIATDGESIFILQTSCKCLRKTDIAFAQDRTVMVQINDIWINNMIAGREYLYILYPNKIDIYDKNTLINIKSHKIQHRYISYDPVDDVMFGYSDKNELHVYSNDIGHIFKIECPVKIHRFHIDIKGRMYNIHPTSITEF
jgi:hypothetical protein